MLRQANMKPKIFSFFLLCQFLTLNAQVVEVADTLGELMWTVDNSRIRDGQNDRILLTVQGNLIFQGNSDNQEDIILLVKANDIFSKRTGEILSKDLEKVLYTIHNGKFFLGKTSIYIPDFQIGFFERDKEDDRLIRFYEGNSDKLLAEISGKDVTTGKLAALFYLLTNHFNLDEKISSKVKIEAPQENSVEDTYGTIRRLWDTGMDEFVWDGKTITRKWNPYDFEEWTFDGTILKREWYPGNEEFIWDGKVLKRRWYPSNDEFEWDGTILRRRWGTGRDEFIIQGNIVKRYFDTSGKDEWQIDGEIPIPIITLVVFNLLRK